MRILVVERDHALAQLLEQSLRQRGHDVELIGRGDRALQMATEQRYDAIVMDQLIPGLDGSAVCARLRDRGVNTHVIILSAQASIDDRVKGLNSGADDYMAKPFALRELHARLGAVQRRGSRSAVPGRSVLRVGELELNLVQGRVQRSGVEITLRPKELAVLETLVINAGRVVSRFELLEAAWPSEHEPKSNVIDVTIRRLRARIDEPFGSHYLQTVRGRGFRLSISRDTDPLA